MRQNIASLLGLPGGILMSACLLLFGVLTLLLLYWPVLVDAVTESADYRPQLPLAEEREEPFYDIESERASAIHMYPPLPDPENVTDGGWIRIPAIDVNVPLAASPSLDDKDILATLDSGAALYPNGILPGRLGNVFVSAHSTGEPWKGKYRFAFLRIGELTPNNVIHIDYQGTRYSYRITETNVVAPTADFRVVSDRPVPTVTVMACWPLWSTSQRMLVRGELTNITKLTEKPT